MRVLPPGAAQVSQMRMGVAAGEAGLVAGWAAAASSATRREPSSRWGRLGSRGKRVAVCGSDWSWVRMARAAVRP